MLLGSEPENLNAVFRFYIIVFVHQFISIIIEKGFNEYSRCFMVCFFNQNYWSSLSDLRAKGQPIVFSNHKLVHFAHPTPILDVRMNNW